MEIPDTLTQQRVDWLTGIVGSTIDRALHERYGIQPCRLGGPDGPESFLNSSDSLSAVGFYLQKVYARSTRRLQQLQNSVARSKVDKPSLKYTRTFLQSRYDNAVADKYDYRPCWDGPSRHLIDNLEMHHERTQLLGFLTGLIPATLHSLERTIERQRS